MVSYAVRLSIMSRHTILLYRKNKRTFGEGCGNLAGTVALFKYIEQCFHQLQPQSANTLGGNLETLPGCSI